MKTTITITSFTRHYGDLYRMPWRDECGNFPIFHGEPDPPSIEIEMALEGDGSTYTHHFDMDLSCPQFERLEKEYYRACELFRKQRQEEERHTPEPNYQGHKVKRVVSYDYSGSTALLELENAEGQWCVLFNSLDLWTQGFILDEWRKRTAKVCGYGKTAT